MVVFVAKPYSNLSTPIRLQAAYLNHSCDPNCVSRRMGKCPPTTLQYAYAYGPMMALREGCSFMSEAPLYGEAPTWRRAIPDRPLLLYSRRFDLREFHLLP